MMCRPFLQRLAGMGAASLLNMVFTALLSILLARLLAVSDFGITRTATSYMIVLTMIGHFTLHNAVASHIARTRIDPHLIADAIVSAATLVATLSTLVAILAALVVVESGYWPASVAVPLAWIFATLPLVCLTITFNACLEALNNLRTYAFLIASTGLVPLLLITPLSHQFAISGWIGGRIGSAALLLVISAFALRRFWRHGRFTRSASINLLVFARIQIISGVLSLVLMSADVITLERLTGDMNLIANYGAALLFTSACAIFPTVLGRIYLREIAASTAKRNEFLLFNALLGASVGVLLYLLGPIAIALVFGEDYAGAQQIVRIQAFGLTASFLWTALSFVNIAEGRPRNAAAISLTGAIVGVCALVLLIPQHHAMGAAWAIVAANVAGSTVGLLRLRSQRPTRELPAL